MSDSTPQPQVILRQRKPLFDKVILRTFMGIGLFLGAIYYLDQCSGPGIWNNSEPLWLMVFGWLPSWVLTDKYRHKYAQRYYSYLLASHGKAFLVLLFAFILILLFTSNPLLNISNLWMVLVYFSLVDFAVSVPSLAKKAALIPPIQKKKSDAEGKDSDIPLVPIYVDAVLANCEQYVGEEVREFIAHHADEGNSSGLGHVANLGDGEKSDKADENGLVIMAQSINNVRLLDATIKNITSSLPFGGYGLVHYIPLDCTNDKLKQRFSGPFFKIVYGLHFVWKRVLPKIPVLDKIYFSPVLSWLDYILHALFTKNRVISKSEMYGRLISQGMSIRGNMDMGHVQFVLFQKTAKPVPNKKPSYYAVVALEKVGMDGEVVRLHKFRSMYPYSEFMQQYMYETEGLNDMGKFKNDYRLSEYGPFIRKYWIDELPQLFDWLRGDIKLIGMRATSPQYLSLYPPEVYYLYIQVKPGLVPPIFDENTTGLDDIVRIELNYLEGYLKSPIKADLGLFYKTFSDIFIRGVRSN
jgi:lipopolysaccharide/colanic/teichoic acid biosynthesis glycosyltransferase